jgi:hypothetical protein
LNFSDFSVANGYIKALSCPPMNRFLFTPRATTIYEVVMEYPPESPKDTKIREKRELDDRKKIRKNASKKEYLKVKGLF